jgi:adenylate cyclase
VSGTTPEPLARGRLTRAYARLGPRYPRTALIVTFHVQHIVVLMGVAALGLYLPASFSKYLLLAAAAVVGQEIYGVSALRYFTRRIQPIASWIEEGRTAIGAPDAWRAAASVPLELLRQWLRGAYVFTTILGWALFATWLLDQPAYAIAILSAAAAVAVTYGNALGFFLMERAMRPVLDDLASHLDDEADPEAMSLPLGRRLLLALPALNVITGVVVVGAADGGQAGLGKLGAAIGISLAVALTVTFGLSVLLASSVAAPIDRLTEATEKVASGDLGTRVPVVASDETGTLTRGFNQMVSGLQERERLREAFGTFVDPDLAERVAREGTDVRGEELEVSILFMDVRGFTSYAEHAAATDVVSRLNDLFELVVPIVLAHGGHANKFIGDGLLAVFGAPERHPDHADRAVAAGLEIAQSVRERYDGRLRVGLGVHSGPVVVGTIGGGGRLDFTVIGDTVNTASRVESATRKTGDDLLITAATYAKLRKAAAEWQERPSIELKGKSEEIRLLAPSNVTLAPPSAGERKEQ